MELIENKFLKIVTFVSRKELFYLGVVSEIGRRIEANHIDHFLLLTDEVFQLRDICAICNEYTRVGVVGRTESFEVRDRLVSDKVDVVEGVA